MDWTHLISRLGRHNQTLAFIYAAEVGVTVEHSAFALNRGLSLMDLKSVLCPEPGWLRAIQGLLSNGWPQMPVTSADQLVYLALLSCKAMLGVGAIIPDGPPDEMQHQFFELFPGIAEARKNRNKEEFVTTDFHVTIDASGSHKTCFGFGPGGRPGRELPIPNPHTPFGGQPHTWTAWEIAMKNLLRQDIQAHIDAAAYVPGHGLKR
jgi:hypothetical protein